MGAALRQDDRPWRIAGGLAVGAFFAFSPLLGLQLPLAVAAAYGLRLNKTAALAGTLLNMPLTAPLFYVAELAIGQALLGIEVSVASLEGIMAELRHVWYHLANLDVARAHETMMRLIETPDLLALSSAMLLGSVLLGGGAALLAYIMAHRALVRLSELTG